MPDHPGKQVETHPKPTDCSYRTLQRTALCDLLNLSAEPVRTAEAPIEKKRSETKAAIDHLFEQKQTRLKRRHQQLAHELEQKHHLETSEIEKLYESDLATLQTKSRSLRRQIAQDAEHQRREAKNQFEHEAWLNESVIEAARNHYAKDTQRIKKEAAARRQQVESLAGQAHWILSEYGEEKPQDSASAEGTAEPIDHPDTVFQEQWSLAEEALETLDHLRIPNLFRGFRPYAFMMMLATIGLLVTGWLTLIRSKDLSSFLVAIPLACIASIAIVLVIGRLLRPVARSHIAAAYEPVAQALRMAEQAVVAWEKSEHSRSQEHRDNEISKAQSRTEKAKLHYDSTTAGINERQRESLEQAEQAEVRLRDEIQHRRDIHRTRADEELAQRGPATQQRYEQLQALLLQRYEHRRAECQQQHASARSELEQGWKRGLARIDQLLKQTGGLPTRFYGNWHDSNFENWSPPQHFTSAIRFGRIEVDLTQLANSVSELASFEVEGTSPVSLPALLSLPDHCSLLIQTGREGLEAGILALQAVMVRLLTSLPAGRAHFTIIDPVGLGKNFAGFMHLADYEEALVGGRIWTDASHIEQRLTDLTNHMENVIQKYLRNEFETIDEYNVQAGELAEPYRFLVIANFPTNFNEEAMRRLTSVVNSGARCGIHTLIVYDRRETLPAGIQIEDIEAGSINIVHDGQHFVWQDDIYRQFPLHLDRPPTEESLTRLMHMIGEAARESSRVEVPFETIIPSTDELLSGDSSTGISVPIGRTGAVRLQYLRLGKGMAQHALIAGKTGSGKSTLFHVMITNLVLWYPPDEVEFYLIDFKKGVEFKTYATHELPHARAVAIESDREFGLSVLQRIDEEMQRRGDLFRQTGVQDVSGYRQATGQKIPRTLLIVDEFQVFFSEDDKLSQDAAVLLDRLVRQGRAFGIHVLLGSQTLGGTSGLPRSTIGQMAVRIALQCSEADSQLILDDDNTAARLLSRPGEALYNDAGGLVEGNSPFQTAWLPDNQRDQYLTQAGNLARQRLTRPAQVIVFEGNAPANPHRNQSLTGLLAEKQWPASMIAPQVWFGEAVAIKDPTSMTFRPQSGTNLLMVGQRDEAALAMMTTAMISLAAQHEPHDARFMILDGSPADSPHLGYLAKVADALPHETRIIEWRDVAGAISELADETQQRQLADQGRSTAIYLIIYGLQRYRMLRRREDDFSFSMDEEEKPPAPEKQFAEILREGPPLHLHTLAWSDTPIALERTFDRQTMREFDNRILFQMSAADSSNLIDSPAANQLGYYRALFYSEEQGVLEKFRPYALPEVEWLKEITRQLQRDNT